MYSGTTVTGNYIKIHGNIHSPSHPQGTMFLFQHLDQQYNLKLRCSPWHRGVALRGTSSYKIRNSQLENGAVLLATALLSTTYIYSLS